MGELKWRRERGGEDGQKDNEREMKRERGGEGGREIEREGEGGR